MKKKIAFSTFGCKLNFAETSEISRNIQKKNFELVDYKEFADVYVINTCTVTANADKKCKTAIKQALHRNPKAKIAVMGCLSQLKALEISEIDGVDLVLGNTDKFLLPDFLDNLNKNEHAEIYNHDILKEAQFIPSYSITSRTRSFFKIQDGCDYFCTYCAIPFARGRSRNDTIANTIKIANEIGQTKIKEVVLTGINIGDFGKHHNESFYQLITQLEKVNGIERYRISSIEPDLLTNEIIGFVNNSVKFMPHFHIPLQSGNNRILKLMHRKYPRELFAERVIKIKELMPDCCVACDVIVGFPSETNEEFNDTLQFLGQLDISYIHVFTYSPRPNTLALKIDEKVSEKEKKTRSQLLHQLSEEKKLTFYKSNIGKTVKVLWESDVQNGFMFGFTDNYIRVKTTYDPSLVNEIKTIRLENMDSDGIFLV